MIHLRPLNELSIFSYICSILTFLIGCKIFTKRAALFYSISLFAMPLWFQYSRYASPDIIYISIFLLCIFILVPLNHLSSISQIPKINFIFIGLLCSFSFFIRSFISILPTWLATLDPEKTSKIGLIYAPKQTALINDFKILVQNQYKTKNFTQTRF